MSKQPTPTQEARATTYWRNGYADASAKRPCQPKTRSAYLRTSYTAGYMQGYKARKANAVRVTTPTGVAHATYATLPSDYNHPSQAPAQRVTEGRGMTNYMAALRSARRQESASK